MLATGAQWPISQNVPLRAPLDGEFVDDVFGVPEGARQPVQSGDDERVAVSAGGEGFS
jgi:hypothetical protein